MREDATWGKSSVPLGLAPRRILELDSDLIGAGPEDVAQDQEDLDKRIECPVLALWGEDFDWVGKGFDLEEIWSGYADDLRTVSLPNCSHLPQEEHPQEVNRHLLDFLDGWSG